MRQTLILQPMIALAAWTVLILLLLAFRHIKEARLAKELPSGRTFDPSARETSTAALANRNYMNLLESPTLFYVACITAFVTGNVSVGMVAAAWGYVGLRVIHSLIHVTCNRVAVRSTVFSASIALLALLWTWIAMEVFKASIAV